MYNFIPAIHGEDLLRHPSGVCRKKAILRLKIDEPRPSDDSDLPWPSFAAHQAPSPALSALEANGTS